MPHSIIGLSRVYKMEESLAAKFAHTYFDFRQICSHARRMKQYIQKQI